MDFNGILFFPVTPFDAAGRIDGDLLREHISTTLRHSPGGVFPATLTIATAAILRRPSMASSLVGYISLTAIPCPVPNSTTSYGGSTG